MEGVSPSPSFWVTGRGMLGHLCVLHTTQNPWNSLECCLRPFLCLKIPLSELLLSPLTGSHSGSRISSSFFKPVSWLIKRRLFFFFLKKYFFKFLIFLCRGILPAHTSVVVIARHMQTRDSPVAFLALPQWLTQEGLMKGRGLLHSTGVCEGAQRNVYLESTYMCVFLCF